MASECKLYAKRLNDIQLYNIFYFNFSLQVKIRCLVYNFDENTLMIY